jgi:flagellin
MTEVTLTFAVRQNLLSLQSTSDLISRTQNRLSTGLRVASPIDDPVNFFQAKGLRDRASDFTEKKSGIDQGISSLTAATDAITGVQNLVQQLKGLATNAKSATTTTEITNIVSQFNDLRTQINNLASDAAYQGLNLVNGSGSSLSVTFSNDTASVLSVNSVDIRVKSTGLNVAQLSANTGTFAFNVASLTAGNFSSALTGSVTGDYSGITATLDLNTIGVTVAGQTAQTITAGDTITLAYGGLSFTVNVVSSLDAYLNLSGSFITAGTYAVGSTVEFRAVTGTLSATSAGTGFSAASAGSGLSAGVGKLSVIFTAVANNQVYSAALGFGVLKLTGTTVAVAETDAVRSVGIGFTTELNSRIQNLDSALTTLRSRAQVLGSNVALLNTRLDFTKNYVNTLTAGAGKLTLADLNEEGANLLALQTRQQLGIQSLAFAGQSEQSILGLFR